MKIIVKLYFKQLKKFVNKHCVFETRVSNKIKKTRESSILVIILHWQEIYEKSDSLKIYLEILLTKLI